MSCEHCGAQLSLEDMTRPNCPYCRNVLKHHARAAEQAALVNQMLDQRLGGHFAPGQAPRIGYEFGAPAPQVGTPLAYQQAQQVARSTLPTSLLLVLLPLVLMALAGAGGFLYFLLR